MSSFLESDYRNSITPNQILQLGPADPRLPSHADAKSTRPAEEIYGRPLVSKKKGGNRRVAIHHDPAEEIYASAQAPRLIRGRGDRRRDGTVREGAHKHSPSGFGGRVAVACKILQHGVGGRNVWPRRLMDWASALVVFFLQHNTQRCMAMITCSQAAARSGWRLQSKY